MTSRVLKELTERYKERLVQKQQIEKQIATMQQQLNALKVEHLYFSYLLNEGKKTGVNKTITELLPENCNHATSFDNAEKVNSQTLTLDNKLINFQEINIKQNMSSEDEEMEEHDD